MKLSHLSFRLQRAVAHRGLFETLSLAPRKIIGRISHAPQPKREVNPVHPFDAEFGTDTSGRIEAEELFDRQRRKNIHNTGFYAASPSQFSAGPRALGGRTPLQYDGSGFRRVPLPRPV
jgi:hypothetical protein